MTGDSGQWDWKVNFKAANDKTGEEFSWLAMAGFGSNFFLWLAW